MYLLIPMNFNFFEKVTSIINIQELGLPTPETIFISDSDVQIKDIEDFIENRNILTIRSDKIGQTEYCPHNLKCPKHEVINFVRELNSNEFVAIIQEYIPWEEPDFFTILSGNILLLKKYIVIEMMEGGPITLLNRYGKMDEHIQIKRYNNFEETFHFGNRLISKNNLHKVLKLTENLSFDNKIFEFSIGNKNIDGIYYDWLYFWHIKDDKTSKSVEQNISSKC